MMGKPPRTLGATENSRRLAAKTFGSTKTILIWTKQKGGCSSLAREAIVPNRNEYLNQPNWWGYAVIPPPDILKLLSRIG